VERYDNDDIAEIIHIPFIFPVIGRLWSEKSISTCCRPVRAVDRTSSAIAYTSCNLLCTSILNARRSKQWFKFKYSVITSATHNRCMLGKPGPPYCVILQTVFTRWSTCNIPVVWNLLWWQWLSSIMFIKESGLLERLYCVNLTYTVYTGSWLRIRSDGFYELGSVDN